MRTSGWQLLALLTLLGNVVHAQTACPAGMEEYGVGVCGYSQAQEPAQQSQQHAPQYQPAWDSRWLAIATDSAKGILGNATDMANKSDAERTAMANCEAKGGTQCKVDVSFGNGCAAMVSGDSSYNVQGAPTLDEATQVAMKTCNKATSHCHVYYSACSLPVRIR
jgi:hypothetical protein